MEESIEVSVGGSVTNSRDDLKVNDETSSSMNGADFIIATSRDALELNGSFLDYIGSDQPEEGSSEAVGLVARAASICYLYLSVIEETIKPDEIYTFSDIEMSDAYYWGTFSSKDDGTMSVDGIIAVEDGYVFDVSGSINMSTETGDATITDKTGEEYEYTLNSEDLDS